MCALCALVGNAAGSGIFIRGGVTNWNADPAWEFQTTEKEGVYTLADKELFGQFKVADANWSDACNYGGISGAVPQLGMSYSLVPGGQVQTSTLATQLTIAKQSLLLSTVKATHLSSLKAQRAKQAK